MRCPNCNADDAVKNGHDTYKSRKWRKYKCRACGKTFSTHGRSKSCVCGLIGCDCGGDLGTIITYADGFDTADEISRPQRFVMDVML